MNSQTKTGPGIKFTNVGLTLGNTDILNNVNFEVAPGSIHCLIGPNGGGKSSLIKSLLGQTPYKGDIRINWQTERVIGYVPQTLSFDLSLPITVENLMAAVCQSLPVFLGVDRSMRRTIDDALDLVGMKGKIDRQLGQLSGGERQRVMFAQAMIPSPHLLILDEPMTGLDKKGEDIINRLITDLSKEKGVTILWINHDLHGAREIADAVTCINRTVTVSGDPLEILSPDNILNIFDAATSAETLV